MRKQTIFEHKKTRTCVFSPISNKHYISNKTIIMNNQTINQIGENDKNDAIKYLGIILDKQLTWKTHADISCSKIPNVLFIINRVNNCLPHSALKALYYTLIHSHMTYGIQAWGNVNSIAKLFVLQKRAIRIIHIKTI